MVKIKELVLQGVDINKYPKAKKLFDDTIKQLRVKFKKLNDDELQAFAKQILWFFKSYA